MSLKRIIYLAIVLVVGIRGSSAMAQMESRYWTWGVGNTPGSIEFDPSNNFQPTFSWTSIPGPPARPNYSSEGNVVATDPVTGNLLFYTDGDRVFNPNHTLVNSLNFLGANSSSAEPTLVLQVPSCPLDSFYIFSNTTGTPQGGFGFGPIQYRKYVPSNGTFDPPLGSPPIDLPQSLVFGPMAEGMILVPHRILPDVYWLICNSLTTGNQLVYRIDPSGISFNSTTSLGPQLSAFSGIHDYAYTDTSMRNPNFGEIAFNRRDPSNRVVWTCLFDAVNGVFLPSSLNVVTTAIFGILLYNEWSPSGRYLYYSTYLNVQVFQVDILTNVISQVFPSATGARGGGLRVGPDGRLYVVQVTNGAPNNPSFSVLAAINTPDLAVNAPGFSYQQSVASYPDLFGYNLPLPAIFVDTTICSTVLDGEVPILVGTAVPGEGIRLQWSAQELADCQRLRVVRGIGEKTEIFTWDFANGPANQSPGCIDVRPEMGMNHYQLLRTDLSGRTTRSEVIPVEWREKRSGWELQSVHADDFMLLRRIGKGAMVETIRLRDLKGRIIRELAVGPGISQVIVPVAGLSAGAYLVEWRSDKGGGAFRVLVP